jgi:hypothetical protein
VTTNGRSRHLWVACLLCATNVAACATPSPSDGGSGDGDTSGDGDGDPGDGDGDPGDGDGDPGDGDGDGTGDGDPGDGIPYRTAGLLWSEVGRIRLALYDSASGWDDPIDVNSPDQHWNNSALSALGTIGDTGVTVLWDQYTNGQTPIWARRYDQDLGWETPEALDPNTPFRFTKSVIALPDGQTLAMWRQSAMLENGTYTVAYACRDRQGTWGTIVPSDKRSIDVLPRQDRTMVVFDVDYAAPQIVAQVFNQGGGTEWCSQPLGEATPLDPTIDSIRLIPIRDQGGPLIHAIWRSDDTRQVETAHFDSATLTWSEPTLLPTTVNSSVPAIGDTIIGGEDVDGNALLVSNDVGSENMRLHAHHFSAETGTWSDTLLLDQLDHTLYFPALAVAPGGDAFVAAQIEVTDVDEPRDVVGFAWSDAEQSWSELIELGITSESYSNTLVEIEPESGDVFVTWTHDNEVQLRHFDAQAQSWSERVFPTAFDQHSVRYLRAVGNGEVLMILHDNTLDFPDSIGTLRALVHDEGGWGPEHVLVANANVGIIRPFVAQP